MENTTVKDEGHSDNYIFTRHALCDLLPPVRPHLLKLPATSEIAIAIRIKLLLHKPVEAILYSSYDRLDR